MTKILNTCTCSCSTCHTYTRLIDILDNTCNTHKKLMYIITNWDHLPSVSTGKWYFKLTSAWNFVISGILGYCAVDAMVTVCPC